MQSIDLVSTAFNHNGFIPAKYTCDGENINPPLQISGIPPSTKALVLVMDDPDAIGGNWDHWVVFNIPPGTVEILENSDQFGVSGPNSWGKEEYGGPCPNSGVHRYFFRIYALNSELVVPKGANKRDVQIAMQDRILGLGELVGLYGRNQI